MLASMRLVVAGAEKLPNKILDDFKQKFGLDIYEGYGTTETAPVALSISYLTGDEWAGISIITLTSSGILPADTPYWRFKNDR
jgi:acyl-CoA synthetase (AMP-forming)/AMP-acid ligase II